MTRASAFLSPSGTPHTLPWPELIPARLERRYQRFLADVRCDDGALLTVHCPNTGAMTGCAEPGSRVWLSRASGGGRKYPHTWELVETATGLACIHSARANALVAAALAAGGIDELAGYQRLRREVRLATGSRIDFLLDEGPGAECLVEVKSVTLCDGEGLGQFPDAPSLRALRHLDELVAARQAGRRAVLLFCALHNGVREVAPADRIDPRYGAGLRQALAAGVEVIAWGADIDTRAMVLARPLPVRL